jgi:hypothetical protein
MVRAIVAAALALAAAAGMLVLGYFGFQAYLKWLLRGQSPPVSYE